MTAKIFCEIYEDNYWENIESKSGSGSTIDSTKNLREALPELLTNLNIKSILDIPCGDFNWMNQVDLTGIDYIGADIVPEMIASNTGKFGINENRQFRVLDLLRDQLPKADLVICRDCLVHFSFEDAFKALEKICDSGAKYLLTTTFPLHKNTAIETGWWYPINLNDEPFPMKEPLLLLNEGCQEPYFWDKCVGLWRMN